MNQNWTVAALLLAASFAADLNAGLPAGELTACQGSTGPDIIVGEVAAEPNGNYANVSGVDAFAWGSAGCNVGTQNMASQGGNPNHPVVAANLYRFRTVNGAARLEQIGMGWVKHFFTTLTSSICCECSGQGGSVLGVGCSDPYNAMRNGVQCTVVGGLGPRFQINAHSGLFPFPYMFRNNCTYMPHNSLTRRCQASGSDLNPDFNPGASYYAEIQYVTADDATAGHQDNNVSHRLVSMSHTDPNYVASNVVGFETVREQAAIRAWRNQDPSVIETQIATPEVANGGGDTSGLCILSARATRIAAHTWHYEYALYNMNSDRSIGAFSLPLLPGYNVTNIGFHDVAYHDGDGFGSTVASPITFNGTDWPGSYAGGTVAWSLVPASPIENSNALRWGTLYNFRFDCNVPPTKGSVALGLFKPATGLPDSVTAESVIPDATAPCPCRGDLDFNGSIDGGDIAPFSSLYLSQSAVSTCADIAQATGTPLDSVDLDAFVNLLVEGANDCE